MTIEERLHDVEKREEQLRSHILRSHEYLRKFDREFKRQVLLLYLSIILLVAFQTVYAWHFGSRLAPSELSMILVTTVLAIVNCGLLIRTKRWLTRINEAWIEPQEKIALDTIRVQRVEIIEKLGMRPSEA